MDLFASDLVERRKRLRFTLLRREAPWTPAELGLLVNAIFTEASTHPQHPGVVIMFGEYSREQIVAALGGGFGEHEIVVGYPNPKLPFMPPGV